MMTFLEYTTKNHQKATKLVDNLNIYCIFVNK
jgi:hypothetical protein